jgi:hypothetical protein
MIVTRRDGDSTGKADARRLYGDTMSAVFGHFCRSADEDDEDDAKQARLSLERIFGHPNWSHPEPSNPRGGI